jgi:hypothetical protein
MKKATAMVACCIFRSLDEDVLISSVVNSLIFYGTFCSVIPESGITIRAALGAAICLRLAFCGGLG